MASDTASHHRCAGRVKVRFEGLTFAHTVGAGERSYQLPELSEANVKRLVHIFKLEGVRRDQDQHVIRGIAATCDCDRVRAVTSGEVSLGEVPLDLHVHCFQGRHRVEAARRVLPRTQDHWWLVEIYEESRGLPADASKYCTDQADKAPQPYLRNSS